MMPLNILTSISNMQPIQDFKYLAELARCSKCQMFIVLKCTNRMYGFSDDCCCIHEIFIPFEVSSDLIFRLDTIDKDILPKYENYFIPDRFPFAIVPDYYWDMYINGDIIGYFNYEEQQSFLLDKTTGLEIEYFRISKTIMERDFMIIDMINQLTAMFSKEYSLGPFIEFNDIHNHRTIRNIYDSKASAGRSLVILNHENGTNIAFYMYKGLFTLNKSDTLDLSIRFDICQPNIFMATFKPKKKKNPMNINTYGEPYKEYIHCMYINLYN